MRAKGNRKVKKTMNMYSSSFSFRQPYQIIVDHEFATAAALSKLKLEEQFRKILNAEVRLMTTRCCTMKSKETTDGGYLALRPLELRKCRCKEISVDCVRHVVGPCNEHRYMIATNNADLKKYCNVNVVGVPVFTVHKGQVVFEEPTAKTKDFAKEKDKQKTAIPQKELLNLQKIIPLESAKTKRKFHTKKKKAKGPNPLSMRKKK